MISSSRGLAPRRGTSLAASVCAASMLFSVTPAVAMADDSAIVDMGQETGEKTELQIPADVVKSIEFVGPGGRIDSVSLKSDQKSEAKSLASKLGNGKLTLSAHLEIPAQYRSTGSGFQLFSSAKIDTSRLPKDDKGKPDLSSLTFKDDKGIPFASLSESGYIQMHSPFIKPEDAEAARSGNAYAIDLNNVPIVVGVPGELSNGLSRVYGSKVEKETEYTHHILSWYDANGKHPVEAVSTLTQKDPDKLDRWWVASNKPYVADIMPKDPEKKFGGSHFKHLTKYWNTGFGYTRTGSESGYSDPGDKAPSYMAEVGEEGGSRNVLFEILYPNPTVISNVVPEKKLQLEQEAALPPVKGDADVTRTTPAGFNEYTVLTDARESPRGTKVRVLVKDVPSNISVKLPTSLLGGNNNDVTQDTLYRAFLPYTRGGSGGVEVNAKSTNITDARTFYQTTTMRGKEWEDWESKGVKLVQDTNKIKRDLSFEPLVNGKPGDYTFEMTEVRVGDLSFNIKAEGEVGTRAVTVKLPDGVTPVEPVPGSKGNIFRERPFIEIKPGAKNQPKAIARRIYREPFIDPETNTWKYEDVETHEIVDTKIKAMDGDKSNGTLRKLREGVTAPEKWQVGENETDIEAQKERKTYTFLIDERGIAPGSTYNLDLGLMRFDDGEHEYEISADRVETVTAKHKTDYNITNHKWTYEFQPYHRSMQTTAGGYIDWSPLEGNIWLDDVNGSYPKYPPTQSNVPILVWRFYDKPDWVEVSTDRQERLVRDEFKENTATLHKDVMPDPAKMKDPEQKALVEKWLKKLDIWNKKMDAFAKARPSGGASWVDTIFFNALKDEKRNLLKESQVFRKDYFPGETLGEVPYRLIARPGEDVKPGEYKFRLTVTYDDNWNNGAGFTWHGHKEVFHPNKETGPLLKQGAEWDKLFKGDMYIPTPIGVKRVDTWQYFDAPPETCEVSGTRTIWAGQVCNKKNPYAIDINSTDTIEITVVVDPNMAEESKIEYETLTIDPENGGGTTPKYASNVARYELEDKSLATELLNKVGIKGSALEMLGLEVDDRTGQITVPSSKDDSWRDLLLQVQAAFGAFGQAPLNIKVTYLDGSTKTVPVKFNVSGKVELDKRRPFIKAASAPSGPMMVTASSESVEHVLNLTDERRNVSKTSGPEWVEVKPDGTIVATPPEGTAKELYKVGVRVDHEDGTHTEFDVDVDVTDPSGATDSKVVYPETAVAGNATVSVKPEDSAGVKVAKYSAKDLPEWLSLDEKTGVLTGTAPVTSSDQKMRYDITVEFEDGSSKTVPAVVHVTPTPARVPGTAPDDADQGEGNGMTGENPVKPDAPSPSENDTSSNETGDDTSESDTKPDTESDDKSDNKSDDKTEDNPVKNPGRVDTLKPGDSHVTPSRPRSEREMDIERIVSEAFGNEAGNNTESEIGSSLIEIKKGLSKLADIKDDKKSDKKKKKDKDKSEVELIIDDIDEYLEILDDRDTRVTEILKSHATAEGKLPKEKIAALKKDLDAIVDDTQKKIDKINDDREDRIDDYLEDLESSKKQLEESLAQADRDLESRLVDIERERYNQLVDEDDVFARAVREDVEFEKTYARFMHAIDTDAQRAELDRIKEALDIAERSTPYSAAAHMIGFDKEAKLRATKMSELREKLNDVRLVHARDSHNLYRDTFEMNYRITRDDLKSGIKDAPNKKTRDHLKERLADLEESYDAFIRDSERDERLMYDDNGKKYDYHLYDGSWRKGIDVNLADYHDIRAHSQESLSRTFADKGNEFKRELAPLRVDNSSMTNYAIAADMKMSESTAAGYDSISSVVESVFTAFGDATPSTQTPSTQSPSQNTGNNNDGLTPVPGGSGSGSGSDMFTNDFGSTGTNGGSGGGSGTGTGAGSGTSGSNGGSSSDAGSANKAVNGNLAVTGSSSRMILGGLVIMLAFMLALVGYRRREKN